MSKEKLLSFDPLTKLFEYHSYDEDTDTTTIRTVGDCEPYLEQNKRLANDTELTKRGIKDEFWLFASIPPAIQVKWLVEEGLDVYNRHHAERVFKKLADPDYRYLKCTYGRHLAKGDGL